MLILIPLMAGSHRCILFAVLLSLVLVPLTSPPPRCLAKDTLKSGESIADGQTLVSAGSIFELGFFAPGRSKNRYVGIWYYNFSTDTVLWVANREAPVRDASGSLSVGDDGNLAILDGGGSVVWSTNASSSSSGTSTETIVQLLDTGNLVLNRSAGMAWQSFDHPTDTYLPGMKVGLDLITDVNQLFTSWSSADDPAPGNFSLGMDPQRSTQIFVWEDGKPRWRSGRWNGQGFTGIPTMVPTYVYGFRLSNFQQEHKMYFFYNAFNSSHRYVLTWDGIVEHLIWADDSKNWWQYWAQPVTECELYNRCGKNGGCSDDGNSPICDCLKGYVPAAAEEWGNGNRTGGCVKRMLFQCERGAGGVDVGADGFWKMEGVKLPDLSEWIMDVSDEGGCSAACLGNCSCTAYAYVDGIGCLVWGELVDIHVFSTGGNDLYLRLAYSEFETKKKVPEFVIAIIALAVILAIGFIYVLFKYNKRIRALFFGRRDRVVSSVNPSGERDLTGGTRSFHITYESNDEKCQEKLPLLSFELILTSTSNFSKENFLGEGGFGPVYKGTLQEGQEVAIKRLSRSSGQGQDEFKNEVILIAKLQHRNLVKLLGCCIQGEEKLLVYEYMPNKSLDVFLFATDPRKKGMLDWRTRHNIVEGIARGLIYLHRDSRLRIIHRDLKASNILLDKDMDPKISDFGMARIFRSEQNETNTTRVMGTLGYMSPEYAMQGVFSVKSDVYSFGVLLLEIVSGRKNRSFVDKESSLNLLGYAWKLWNEDNVMEFVDPAIRDACSLDQVSRCVNVGLLCVQDRANDRPTMSTVVAMLESGTTANPQPRQPTFAAERGPSDTESSILDHRSSLANDSITLLVGR